MKEKQIFGNFNFWRHLVNIWSVLFFTVIIYDFATWNSCTEVLNVMSTVYIGSLAVYVSNKEFERWYDKHYSRHPGEIFVIIWSVLILVLFSLSFIFNEEYKMPTSVISSYIAVLTILAVTRKSKELYLVRHQSKSKGKK